MRFFRKFGERFVTLAFQLMIAIAVQFLEKFLMQ